MKKISVILPCCNEEENILPLYRRLKSSLPEGYSQEIIFVDDGSRDQTLARIKELTQKDPNVFYLSFTRNFGHQPALKAGLDYCRGDCAITMDADLQHPPEVLREMIQQWESGFAVVNARRNPDEHFSVAKRVAYRAYYRWFSRLTGLQLEEGTADFRLTDRKVLTVLRTQFGEYPSFLRGSFSWMGFSHCTIPYTAPSRQAGSSKYPLSQLIALGSRGFSSFSVKPLRWLLYLGVLLMFSGVFTGLFSLWFAVGKEALLFSGMLLLAGIQLAGMGILGVYLGGLIAEVKKRPVYLVNETNWEVGEKA